jgi:hypothetical protein
MVPAVYNLTWLSLDYRRRNMDEDKDTGDNFGIEDYGSPGTDSVRTSMGGGFGDRTDEDITPTTNSADVGATEAARRGGDETADSGRFEADPGDTHPGAQFGEFGHTGVGTDLNIEMENTDARTGLVKGGEHGEDDVAGPGQYGGATGGIGSEKSS